MGSKKPQPALRQRERADLLDPNIRYDGLTADHDMPCAVCHKRPAILDIKSGAFEPCINCQDVGWDLRRSAFKRAVWWCLKLFYGDLGKSVLKSR